MPVYPRLGIDVGDADAAVGDVLNPRTFYSVAPPRKTGVMPTVTLDPALNAYPAGYHAGAPSLTVIEADLVPSKIMYGETIFGVLGTMITWIYDLGLGLIVPQPSISVAVAEDHSGGGQTIDKSLVIPPPAISLFELALFDQRYDTDDDGDLSIQGLEWEAQTFTTLQAHPIEIIEIRCRLVGSAVTVGNITISIKDVDGAGLPNGLDLTSVTFPASDLPTTNAWITKYLVAHGLNAATKYAKVIRASGGNGANYMVWRKDGTVPTYAGGARCFSNDGGATWTEDVNNDFMFREGEVI